jgi:formate dehydrogenase iron-sulfur subunit
VKQMQADGLPAYIYGDEEVGGTNGIGDLHAFFLLLDKPSKYNLPANPSLPQDRTLPGVLTLAATALALGAATAWSLRKD